MTKTRDPSKPTLHRATCAVVATLIFGLGLAACSSSSKGRTATSPTKASSPAVARSSSRRLSSTPFNLTAIVAESGSLQSVTLAEYQGLEAGAVYVNSHGGVDGHPIHLTEQNDNLNPTTAADLLEQDLSSGAPPNEVYAGTTSNETAAIVSILTSHKILSMQEAVSNTTINAKKFPYAFTLGPSTPDAAANLAAALKHAYPNAKSVGMIIGNGVNGSSLLTNEKAALEAVGLKVFVQTYASNNTVDVTPQMEALKADNPDVLVASGFGPVAGYILEARAKLGWTVPVVGDAAFSANPLPSMVPAADLTGVVIATYTTFLYKPLSQESQAYKTFVRLTKAEGSNFVEPIVIYSLAYDVPIMAMLAGDQARSVNSSALASALENLRQPNPAPYVTYPVIKFSSTQHSPILSANLAAVATPYLKDGLYVPVGSKLAS